VYPAVREAIEKNSAQTGAYLPWITISRIVERIADHATNIAEDVIYLVEGEIVRHKRLD
jgi:phosphate transport system protein